MAVVAARVVGVTLDHLLPTLLTHGVHLCLLLGVQQLADLFTMGLAHVAGTFRVAFVELADLFLLLRGEAQLLCHAFHVALVHALVIGMCAGEGRSRQAGSERQGAG